MLEFKKVNVNFKGRKTGDCVTRALTTALGIDYLDVIDLQVAEWKRSGYELSTKRNYEEILSEYGFIKKREPRTSNNKRYRLKDYFTETKGVIVVATRRHLTVIKDGVLCDTWDPRKQYVMNYYIKID